jgi:hypothetical protein
VLDNPLLALLLPLIGQLRVNSVKNFSRNLVGAGVVALLGVAALPAFSQTAIIDAANRHHPAPVPIAGAGLPFLAVVGVYWLIRRRRKSE